LFSKNNKKNPKQKIDLGTILFPTSDPLCGSRKHIAAAIAGGSRESRKQERTLCSGPFLFMKVWRKMNMSESRPLLLGDVPGLRTMFMTNLDPPKDI